MAEDLKMYSDASKNPFLGFGCRFNKDWAFHQWENGFIVDKDPSIEYLELYALCVGVFIWSDRLRNHRFILYCDNESVVNMVNHISSGSKHCMYLIRKLTRRGMDYNFRVFCCHIYGKNNEISDALSRLDGRRFKRLQQKKQAQTQSSSIAE